MHFQCRKVQFCCVLNKVCFALREHIVFWLFFGRFRAKISSPPKRELAAKTQLGV